MTKGSLLSDVDRRVLRELQRDGSITNAALGNAVHVSESAAARHRHGLKRDGYIERYAAIVNIEQLGYGEVAFTEVGLTTQSEDAQAAFEEAVRQVEEVLACYAIAGEFDYLLHIIARDRHHYGAGSPGGVTVPLASAGAAIEGLKRARPAAFCRGRSHHHTMIKSPPANVLSG